MNKSSVKLDLLVIAVHPDDAELGCSGTIAKQVALGRNVGIVDLTRGELGSRGSAETRDQEAAAAAGVLKLTIRENLGMADGFFQNDRDHQLQLIRLIRKYQPEIVITNALDDRHPDHGRAGDLANDALFLSGLRKIETFDEQGNLQAAHRPRLVLQMIQDRYIKPDIVIDISEYWEVKLDSIRAYSSQFFNTGYSDDAKEPQTYISTPEFLEYVEARAMEFGKHIGARYGEGFTSRKLLGIDDVFNLK